MTPSTHTTRRLVTAITAAILVTGVAAPAAPAGGYKQLDGWVYTVTHRGAVVAAGTTDHLDGWAYNATAAKLALQPSALVIRDAGDATAAKLALQSSPLVIRDAGDATAAKLALQSSALVIRDAGDATAAKLALQPSALVIRDAGDATAAKLALQSSPLVIRDAGDATAAKLALQSSPAISSPEEPSAALGQEIDWAQLGIGFGVGMFLVLGVILAVRVTRSHRLAH